MKSSLNILKVVCIGALLILATTTSAWAGGGKHKSPQDLHTEFMGYAQEYYAKADHLQKKARHSEGGESKKLLELANLNQQMGDLKVEMAEGFLKQDHAAVDQAVQKYQHLRGQADNIWKTKKAHHKSK